MKQIESIAFVLRLKISSRTVVLQRRLSRKQSHPARHRHSTPSDDIPVAYRTVSAVSARRTRSWFKVGQIIVVFFLAVALLTLGSIYLGLFSNQDTRSRLETNLPNDGRLLGHFSYPEAKAEQLVDVAPGMQLMPDAARSFLSMQRDAERDGVSLVLLSAFRSVAQQRQLFFDIKAQRNQNSIDRAKVSAPPGFSEHSTGYAIDLGDLSDPKTNLSPTFVKTNAYRWLKNHAARYQYTLSFPKGNPQGVSFEPWHWRFEGSVQALRLFEPAQRLVRSKEPGPER